MHFRSLSIFRNGPAGDSWDPCGPPGGRGQYTGDDQAKTSRLNWAQKKWIGLLKFDHPITILSIYFSLKKDFQLGL